LSSFIVEIEKIVFPSYCCGLHKSYAWISSEWST